jgi:hypothetical protein
MKWVGRGDEVATGLNSHDQRQFVERLTEAILWCRDAGSLLRPRTSLRTFKPSLKDLESQNGQVFSVALDRRARLRSVGKLHGPRATDSCGGRLLAYFPDDNLADGVAEAESKGFFDVENIPPYDTWVWMVRNIRAFEYKDGTPGEMEANYLVAWVPPDFIPLAGGGIDVNPEGCIVWLDTLDDEFVQSVRRLGLFGDAPAS